MVVFKALGNAELNRIVDIELALVQQRIESSAVSKPFFIDVTNSARELLLTEGTNFRYGARPLKGAIEQLLVEPLCNLIATGQIHSYDCIRVTHSKPSRMGARQKATQ
jgi:ATP-dependent Clp protease ATP-binding subunit ClpC